MGKTPVYTIGYGGRGPGDFLELLKARGVRSVVDVRIAPQRACMGSYVKAKTPDKGIERLLASAGIQYFSFTALGNRFKDAPDWAVPYQQLLDRDGVALVEPLQQIPQPFCLMCCEKRVAACHRKLIADFMASRGHDIEHIE